MTQLKADLSNLESYFKALVAEYNVVGASLAVLDNGRVHTAVAGSLNLDTGVDVTTDSLFQIGSVSKVFTATLIMQLVDEGRLALDEPVITYLPSFHIADPDATASITIRQLLCHTSGMEGDFFPEDDQEGPSISSYMAKCYLLPQLHPVGKNLSYCNSGYVTLGRVIEVVEGTSWAVAIASRLLRPLGMDHSIVDPRESLRFRVAMGHVSDPDNNGEPMLAKRCYLALSTAPCGAVLSMSATDLLKFMQLHLNKGIAPEGSRLISGASVKAMQESQITLPNLSWRNTTDWGLGWFLSKKQDFLSIGHDGGTRGQFAYLRLYSGHNKAIALLTNSSSTPLFRAMEKEICDVLSINKKDTSIKEMNQSEQVDINPADYIGRYGNIGGEAEMTWASGVLTLSLHSAIDKAHDKSAELTPIGQHRFIGVGNSPVVFVGVEKGQPAQYMYWGFRLFRRLSNAVIDSKR